MQRRSLILSVATVALAGMVGCQQRAAFNSVDLTGADYGHGFSLTDHNGQPRTLADFKGKLVAVFFGFTQCPDVCPTALAELAETKRLLGAEGDKLQAVFITVDPERDTAPVLKAYMQGFDPSFVALRGSAEQTAAVAREFKVFYAKVPGKTPETYTMDHTAGVYVFDTEGKLRLFSRHAAGAAALAADMKQLLAQS